MKSTCTIKKKGQLVQVEWKWCDEFNRTTLNTSFTWLVTFPRKEHSFLIIYLMPLRQDYIQMSLFPGTPKWSPKTRTLIVPKLWTFISLSNQVEFENAKVIHYNPQKNISKGVQHTPIKIHLNPIFKGFCGQESNSQFDYRPFF